MKIVVVGGGIAGSCVARLARERGHRVTLIGQQAPAHSLAATAVLRRGYHKGAEAQDWDRSMLLYRRWGIYPLLGGQVTNYRTPARAAHVDRDWQMINPATPLVPLDIVDTVVAVEPGVVHTRSGEDVVGDVIVTAPGVSELSPAGRVTWGVTWLHTEPGVLTDRLGVVVHHYAPYKTITAGSVGGRVRLGSSSAASQDAAWLQGRALLAKALDAGMVRSVEGWSGVLGARLQTSEHVARRDYGWWIGGFHRTGYALAPAAAARLVEAL